MGSFITLPVIPRIFASGGQAQSPIPENSTGTNRASYQDGFPPITSQPITDDPSTTGVPPNRLDFNGLFAVATSLAFALQQGQYYTFDSTVSTKIGGYPLNAILWYVDSGVPQYLVRSLVANNTESDLTDTTKWQPLTINPSGFAMTGTLSNQSAAQIRNIEIVNSEPATGVDGTIYCILAS